MCTVKFNEAVIETDCSQCYFFIWGFTSLSTLYRSYHDGWLEGQRKPVHKFVRVLYCKLPTNGKQLPAFPLEAMPGTNPQSQRWEPRVLPLCHHGPFPVLQFILSVHKPTKRYGFSFAYDAAKVGNELPDGIHSAISILSFRKKLKAYLFTQDYPP